MRPWMFRAAILLPVILAGLALNVVEFFTTTHASFVEKAYSDAPFFQTSSEGSGEGAEGQGEGCCGCAEGCF